MICVIIIDVMQKRHNHVFSKQNQEEYEWHSLMNRKSRRCGLRVFIAEHKGLKGSPLVPIIMQGAGYLSLETQDSLLSERRVSLSSSSLKTLNMNGRTERAEDRSRFVIPVCPSAGFRLSFLETQRPTRLVSPRFMPPIPSPLEPKGEKRHKHMHRYRLLCPRGLRPL